MESKCFLLRTAAGDRSFLLPKQIHTLNTYFHPLQMKSRESFGGVEIREEKKERPG